MRNLDFNFRFNLVVLKMLKFVIQNKLAKKLKARKWQSNIIRLNTT